MQNFFETVASFDVALPAIFKLALLLREQGAKQVYLYGLCWGGKVAALAGSQSYQAGEETRPHLDAVASIHPGCVLELLQIFLLKNRCRRLVATDSEGLLVPMALFPSQGEPVEVCSSHILKRAYPNIRLLPLLYYSV